MTKRDSLGNNPGTMMLNNNPQKWLDFVSDIDSGGENQKLLPTSK